MDYELYHDESQVGGYWHGMLLVPIAKKNTFLAYLSEARKNTEYEYPLGIKKVKKRNKVFDCAQAWLTLAVAALRTQTKGEPLNVYLGQWEGGHKKYKPFPDLIVGAKFILFCERDNLSRMTGHINHASKVETTFRIGFKYGLHYLGAEENPIRIELIHFDGYEHHRRHISRTRVIDRLKGLRSYCEISTRQDLIDDRPGNHRRSDPQEYDDCQFLQLTDLMVGAFRSVLRKPTKALHRDLSSPIKKLIDRYRQGFARMQNSRWRNSFCMSVCYLEDGSWKFKPLEYEQNNNTEQLVLSI